MTAAGLALLLPECRRLEQLQLNYCMGLREAAISPLFFSAAADDMLPHLFVLSLDPFFSKKWPQQQCPGRKASARLTGAGTARDGRARSWPGS